MPLQRTEGLLLQDAFRLPPMQVHGEVPVGHTSPSGLPSLSDGDGRPRPRFQGSATGEHGAVAEGP